MPSGEPSHHMYLDIKLCRGFLYKMVTSEILRIRHLTKCAFLCSFGTKPVVTVVWSSLTWH